MNSLKIITALCTPLTEDEHLHVEGLEAHIHDQLENRINGLLVGGTMGAMQLLTIPTYRDLVEKSVQFNAGQSELLVGVGDTSYACTLERIRLVEQFPIDGVVVLAPFFLKFSQEDLYDYFCTLADASSKPLFMYDLPATTGTKLELSTVLKLSRHPNIAGIKCSDHFVATRPLLEEATDNFRVIVAQPLLVDMLLQCGVREHLDGVFGFAPHWIKQILEAYENQDWLRLSAIQHDFAELLRFLQSFSAPLFSTVGELLNLRGIPGKVSPRPFRLLTEAERTRMVNAPIIQKAISDKLTVAAKV